MTSITEAIGDQVIPIDGKTNKTTIEVRFYIKANENVSSYQVIALTASVIELDEISTILRAFFGLSLWQMSIYQTALIPNLQYLQ